MKAVVSLMFVALMTPFASAQGPDTLWTRMYGTPSFEFMSAIESWDSGVLLIARQYEVNGGPDRIQLLRLNGNGDTLWMSNYSAPYRDLASDAVMTSDGGWLIAGAFETWWGSYFDISLTKVDSLGAFQWRRAFTFPDSTPYLDYAIAITADGHDGYFVTSQRSMADRESVHVMSVTSAGDTIWTRTVESLSYDWVASATTDSDGNLIVVGRTTREDFGGDGLVIKLNALGEVIWERVFGDSMTQNLTDVAIAPNGDYFMAGTYIGDIWILKCDSSGLQLSSRIYTMPGNETSSELFLMSDGGMTISGIKDGDFLLMRTDSIGDTIWTAVYGGAQQERLAGCLALPDRTFLLAGSTASFGDPHYDLWIVRTEPEPEKILRVLHPNVAGSFHIADSLIIRWFSYNIGGPIRIELSRDYPTGPWEVLASATDNDGEESYLITDPPSGHCRVKVTCETDSASDVSDDDFAIVYPSSLEVVFADSTEAGVTNWNAGDLECGDWTHAEFRFRNSGGDTIQNITILGPVENFWFASDVGNFGSLNPGGSSQQIFTVYFFPFDSGILMDSLRIETDAANANEGMIFFPLMGTSVTTPIPPQMVLRIEGSNGVLHWLPVSSSTNGCVVDVNRYLVFFSTTPEGQYWYHGYTTDTSYVHLGAAEYALSLFYRVLATTEGPSTLWLMPTNGVLTEEQVIEGLNGK